MYKLLLISILFLLSACENQSDSTDIRYDFDRVDSAPITNMLGDRFKDDPQAIACLQKLYNPDLKKSYLDWWGEVSNDKLCGGIEPDVFEAICATDKLGAELHEIPVEFNNKDIGYITRCYLKPSEHNKPTFHVYENSKTDRWLVKNNIEHGHAAIINGELTINIKAEH